MVDSWLITIPILIGLFEALDLLDRYVSNYYSSHAHQPSDDGAWKDFLVHMRGKSQGMFNEAYLSSDWYYTPGLKHFIVTRLPFRWRRFSLIKTEYVRIGLDFTHIGGIQGRSADLMIIDDPAAMTEIPEPTNEQRQEMFYRFASAVNVPARFLSGNQYYNPPASILVDTQNI